MIAIGPRRSVMPNARQRPVDIHVGLQIYTDRHGCWDTGTKRDSQNKYVVHKLTADTLALPFRTHACMQAKAYAKAVSSWEAISLT